jgi:hypothetical protein
VSFDLWFWKPASTPTGEADNIFRWCSETDLDVVEPVGEIPHNRFVLKGAAHPEITPFDPEGFLRSLQQGLPSALEGEDAPLLLDLVLKEGGGPAVYGDVSLGWSQAEALARPFITAVTRAGFTVYDPQADSLHPACFGERFWLEVEDRWTIGDPKLAQVLGALEDLNPGGPSFAILEAKTGDYVQTAGKPTAMTVEWRSYDSAGFQHFVGGRGDTSSEEARVPTQGGFVTVRANEVLDLQAVQEVFTAFFNGEDRPASLSWRDVTERFGGGQTA